MMLNKCIIRFKNVVMKNLTGFVGVVMSCNAAVVSIDLIWVFYALFVQWIILATEINSSTPHPDFH